MSLPWVEKYRPVSKADLVGNKAAINGLHLFIKNWSRSNKVKAALLLGPAGCGKTSSVYALAHELGYTVTEVNASDTRKKKSIQEILAPATQFTSLTDADKPRIILMDEVDGLSGRYDRGGLSEFIRVIQKTRYPIIGTANDSESKNIKKLSRKKEVRIFEFNRASQDDIAMMLQKITKAENIGTDLKVLKQIADLSAGDIRAAINELESHVYGSSMLQIEERDQMRTLVELFNELYRAKDYRTARKVLSNAPSDYYVVLLHLFDQTMKQCKTPEELARAYDQLANADIVYNRIMRTQDWSLLKYFFDYIGPGLNIARSSKSHKKISKLSSLPSSFISRGISKRVNSRALKLAPKVAPELHISENKFVHSEYRYFEKIVLGQNGGEIAAWLNLDDDDISMLAKVDPNSNLEDTIDEARLSVGKYRVEQGRIKESTLSGLDLYFSEPKESSEEIEDDEEELMIEESKDGQMSLDDFF